MRTAHALGALAVATLLAACGDDGGSVDPAGDVPARNIGLSTPSSLSPLRTVAPLTDRITTITGLELDIVRPREVASYEPAGWVEPSAVERRNAQLWITDSSSDRLLCWSMRTESSCGTVNVSANPIDLTLHDRRLWVLSADDDRVDVVDPRTLNLDTHFETEFAAQSIHSALDHVWVVNNSLGSLTRFEDDTYSTMTTDPGLAYPSYLYLTPTDAAEDAGREALWVTEGYGDVVSRANLAGRKETSISVSPGPVAVAYDGTSLWVGSQDDDVLTRILPNFGIVADTIDLPAAPSEIHVSDEVVWVVHLGGDAVTAVSKTDLERQWTFRVMRPTGAVLDASGDLWVVGGQRGSDPHLTRFTS